MCIALLVYNVVGEGGRGYRECKGCRVDIGGIGGVGCRSVDVGV